MVSHMNIIQLSRSEMREKKSAFKLKENHCICYLWRCSEVLDFELTDISQAWHASHWECNVFGARKQFLVPI